MSPAAEQACQFVQLVAQAQPYPGNALDETIVSVAQKIAAEIRREQFQMSRSGVPLTRESIMSDTSKPTSSARPLDTKRFGGNFLLFRKAGDSLKRGGGASGIDKAKTHRVRPPRFRHPSFAAAEIEAGRLLDLMPESTFVILQEVARVKLMPSDGTLPPETMAREKA